MALLMAVLWLLGLAFLVILWIGVAASAFRLALCVAGAIGARAPRRTAAAGGGPMRYFVVR